MAPRGGPRTQGSAQNTKSTSMKSKAGSRGGIQKKRAGTKTDVDGDLDMDSAARRNKPAAGADGAQSRPNTRSSSARNPRGTSRVAQTVAKHLGTSVGDVPSRGLRARRAQNAPGLSYLRIHGLKQSKAASNQDGGVTDLLSFLERKASSFTAERRKRSIIIKKVCFYIDEVSGCTEFQLQQPQSTIYELGLKYNCRDKSISNWCDLRRRNAPNFNLSLIHI